jgi:hypothetical protein
MIFFLGRLIYVGRFPFLSTYHCRHNNGCEKFTRPGPALPRCPPRVPLSLPPSVGRHSGRVRVLSEILRSSIWCSLLLVHLHLLRSLDSREEWFFLLRFAWLEQIHTSTAHWIEGKLKYRFSHDHAFGLTQVWLILSSKGGFEWMSEGGKWGNE